jgi:hypothetical protein
VAAHWEGNERSCRIGVHYMNGFDEAFSIPDVQELDRLETSERDPTTFTYDRRIQFVPSANVLLTIPSSNDRTPPTCGLPDAAPSGATSAEPSLILRFYRAPTARTTRRRRALRLRAIGQRRARRTYGRMCAFWAGSKYGNDNRYEYGYNQ